MHQEHLKVLGVAASAWVLGAFIHLDLFWVANVSGYTRAVFGGREKGWMK